MSDTNLTKQEALELITPVVDNEVDEDQRIAFFEYIEQDREVRGRYESIKRIKTLVSSRFPSARCPEHLRDRINAFLEDPGPNDRDFPNLDEPILDIPSQISESVRQGGTQNQSDSSYFRYAVAAILLMAFLLGGVFYFSKGDTPIYNVEEYVYTHFEKNRGELIEPTISTASLADAEVKLSEAFDLSMTIPPLENAVFKGVVYSDFVPDFKAPLLEYHLPSENQFIYIFAFNIKKLEQYGKLVRSEEAVKTCIRSQDFHIRNVNGKHVVSWKWNDTWYAAVSNHDGKTLASLVKPLNYEGN